jgi:hypothetical protein
MAKTKEAKKIDPGPLDGEPCDADELNKWSAGRWVAGQHQAALDVQKRYEALIRHQNPDREVEFYRDEETGELNFGLKKTDDELLAELEAEEKAKKEAEEADLKRKAGEK